LPDSLKNRSLYRPIENYLYCVTAKHFKSRNAQRINQILLSVDNITKLEME